MKVITAAPPLDSALLRTESLGDPHILDLVRKCSDNYFHWDELQYRTYNDDERMQVWLLMKTLRRNSAIPVTACGLQLSYVMLPQFTEALHFIDRNSAGEISLDRPGGHDMERYVVNSLMEEAIASSQIEGAITTREAAKKMLRSKRKPRNLSERMIVNNYSCMEFIKTIVDEPLTPEMIIRIHEIITQGTLKQPEWETSFRNTDDIVVGDPLEEGREFHHPPAHDRLPALISAFCIFANGKSDPYIHPIIKATILHFLIGYIHPFMDGNGRLARSLFYWFALKEGYWLFEYTAISRTIKTSQTRYGLAYQYCETDDLDLTYFIKFILESIRKASDELAKYIRNKRKEQQAAIRLIQDNPGLSAGEVQILQECLKKQEIFSIKEIQTKYSLSYQTARVRVKHLASVGYLKLVGKDRKRELYTVDLSHISTVDGQLKFV